MTIVSTPTTLTGLRKLLASLYPMASDQRRLATEAGLNVGVIQLGSSAYNDWHQILTYAKNNRSLDRLIELAAEEYPDNEQLLAFSDGRVPALLDGGEFAWQGPRNAKPLLEQLVSGRSSLVSVAHLSAGLERSRAVAKIVREDAGTGTGFLVAGNRFVTTHHVLPDAATCASAHLLFNYQKRHDGVEEATDSYRLAPQTWFRTNAEDDWTVVAVEGEPCARWGEIAMGPANLRAGDFVNIIQHPGGAPKQMSLTFEAVAFVGEGRVQYLTDTMPGSSGAPVFDRMWNLVAVHHSGGWITEPGTAQQRVFYRNQGVLVERIMPGLDGP